MIAAVFVIVGLTGLIILYFQLPYSITKSEFKHAAAEAIQHTVSAEGVFTADDFKVLPEPMRRYMEQSGFIGKPRMSYMKAVFRKVDFILDKAKPPVNIDYVQYNYAQEPKRLAFIGARMYGIPFQGLDAFVDGKGSMKGVLAKSITLFNQKGPEMDQACLVTFLAETVLLPSALVKDYIRWEPMDAKRVKAEIVYGDLSAGGIFTFTDSGELMSFTTEDRFQVKSNGESVQVPWTVKFGEYQTLKVKYM